MNKDDLKLRVKKYALRIINLVNSLPKNQIGKVIGNQLIRSGTSVAANYYATCRARTKAEFISKIGIVIEEADESAFWLDLIIETKLIKKELIQNLYNETNEIIAIMVSSSKTARYKK